MKQINVFFIILFFSFSNLFSDDQIEFLEWKKNFKNLALSNEISEKTFDIVMNNVKYLPKVIEYDRYQPEFYEDTKTYISKRASKSKVKKGIKRKRGSKNTKTSKNNRRKRKKQSEGNFTQMQK